MSRRRLRHRHEKARRHASPTTSTNAAWVVIREATYVERLAYTRTQAAAALDVSRSTFIRRVLPFVETVETGAGTRLIPVDEIERFLAERRRKAQRAHATRGRPGRKAGLPVEVVARIRDEYAQGKSLGAIANDLNSDRVPTAQGGRQWWPSTVRDVLLRSSLPQAAAGPASRVERPEVLYYDSLVDIHPSARKHGIADDDIEHATKHAMAIDDQDDDTRLYLGPSRSADSSRSSRSCATTAPNSRSMR
jgi:hypothetical protein